MTNTPDVSRPDQYFSSDYTIARGRFQVAVAAAGGRVVSLQLSAKGPNGEPLTIDIGWFGAKNPRRVLVHSSGLHGVEAFAGSAIQLQWLKKGIPPVPADSATVLVHILNPYGAAWLRRFNENNVDLNRNFRGPGESVPVPTPWWDILNEFLNPPTPPTRNRFYLRAARLVHQHGIQALRQAVAGGQACNPKGLFFVGSALEEGPATFQEFMKQHLAGAERIVAIDVHTGLGRFGEDRLLVEGRVDGAITEAMRRVFGERIELLCKEGIAYEVSGAQQDMYFREFPQAEVFFASQEFGTCNSLRVVAALRTENRAHFYGNSRTNQSAKSALLEVFDPKSPKWRRSVLKRGEQVVEQAWALAFEQSGTRRIGAKSTLPPTLYTFDGTPIHCWSARPASGLPRAKIVLVHGFGTHSESLHFGYLSDHLNRMGFSVYGFDLRGFGRSGGRRAYVHRWQDFRDDLRRFMKSVQQDGSASPVFVLGVSLGGLIAVNYALHHPEEIGGVIAMSPAFDVSGVPVWRRVLLRVLAETFPTLAMKTGLDVTRLTRDQEAQRAFLNDPLRQNKMTLRLASETIAAMAETAELLPRLKLPLLVLHGSADTIIPPVAGTRLHELAGSADKELRKFDGGFHILNMETNREEVFDHIAAWINRRLGPAPSIGSPQK